MIAAAKNGVVSWLFNFIILVVLKNAVKLETIGQVSIQVHPCIHSNRGLDTFSVLSF